MKWELVSNIEGKTFDEAVKEGLLKDADTESTMDLSFIEETASLLKSAFVFIGRFCTYKDELTAYS